jgi:hypothetical protein
MLVEQAVPAAQSPVAALVPPEQRAVVLPTVVDLVPPLVVRRATVPSVDWTERSPVIGLGPPGETAK